MMTRREAVRLLGKGALTTWLATAQSAFDLSLAPAALADSAASPALAPGTPMSPQRMALIEAFKRKSEGLEARYEARSYKSDWTMPYRLFRPDKAKGKLPLVLYLHGSGALGNDNEKQLGLGNIFGTRVWLLAENQQQFPCYVVAPQTDRGWIRYEMSQASPKAVPGLGDGARVALEIVRTLCRELPIDEHRLYVTGQSMGGAGTWHMTAQRPKLFAAAVACCGSETFEPAAASRHTAIWNFHGTADASVPIELSRDRIAALRKAGAHPLYTEYAGVDHDVWQWAYTEPELVKWVFSQRKA